MARLSTAAASSFTSLIPVEQYQEMIRYTLDDGRGCPTVCGIEACYIRSCDERYDDYFRTFYKKIVYMDDLTELDRDVNKYTVFFPDNNSEEVYRETYRDAWSDRYTVTNAGKMWIDMMNPGVDKGLGACSPVRVSGRGYRGFLRARRYLQRYSDA